MKRNFKIDKMKKSANFKIYDIKLNTAKNQRKNNSSCQISIFWKLIFDASSCSVIGKY